MRYLIHDEQFNFYEVLQFLEVYLHHILTTELLITLAKNSSP
jgi:hypothetical protein